ncbi:NrdH-redoxin [Arthrobacter sp. AQ5-05]|uniref:glutaredoxin domain-containing protein n=1 Tax=Arthrobacter sp. AQ5-05 TaxID=2184581 RepID=UPI000DCD88A1|nr:glutaredoxin domain-containing protein [Arthrobacter sp. AQ5-05]RAX50892.1 NrdH-redoxin [Arthrobacter sp. AQ5-05]
MATTTLYTKPECRQCDMTKKFLDRAGTPYTAIDISLPENGGDLAAVKALGYMGAPVVVVNVDGDTSNEMHWYGFRPDLLEEFCAPEAAAA